MSCSRSISPSAAMISVRRRIVEAVLDLEQLLADHVHQPLLVGQDRAQLGDALDQVVVLGLDLLAGEAGQGPQPQLQDRLGLDLGQPERVHQAVARGLGVLGGADQRDHLVEAVERDQVALQHVGALLGLVELELGAPGDDLLLVLDVVVEHLLERQRARVDAVHQGDHVHAERALQGGVLVELVQHHLGDGVALQLDVDAHAGAVALVVQRRDLVQHLRLDQLGDLLDDALVAALLDHVGHLGDDQRGLAAAHVLGVHLGPHHDAAAAGLVGLADAGHAHDRAGGGEVGALDVLHQVVDGGVRVVHQLDGGVDRLAQVVRRDVRGHAHGDTRGAVDEQVREPRRQHDRLAPALVVVGHEVDGVGVDVAQHLDRQRRQPALRVAHGRGRVAVLVAEVALAVHQRVAQREPLGHAHQRVVGGAVAVRVVLAQHVAHHRGALRVGAVRLQAALVHREQHAPVHRLEAVAHVGQRAAHDHAHRVIEVAAAHLLRQVALLDATVAQADSMLI